MASAGNNYLAQTGKELLSDSEMRSLPHLLCAQARNVPDVWLYGRDGVVAWAGINSLAQMGLNLLEVSGMHSLRRSLPHPAANDV